MPPVGALFVAFFAVAVPAILLMAVWAAVTALRILFPERSLPYDSSARRHPLGSGIGTPVRLHDILENEKARRARTAAARVEGDREAAARGPRAHPLAEDLWMRRN